MCSIAPWLLKKYVNDPAIELISVPDTSATRTAYNPTSVGPTDLRSQLRYTQSRVKSNRSTVSTGCIVSVSGAAGVVASGCWIAAGGGAAGVAVTPVTVAVGATVGHDQPLVLAAGAGADADAAGAPFAAGAADLCDITYGTPTDAPSRVAIISGRDAIYAHIL